MVEEGLVFCEDTDSIGENSSWREVGNRGRLKLAVGKGEESNLAVGQ